MHQTRRVFLALLAPFSLIVLAPGTSLAQERPRSPMPNPPERAGPSETQTNQVAALPSGASLEQREGAFRRTVSELYEKIGHLKAEVDNAQTSRVFSVKMFKEASESEKLAKQLKNLSRA